MDFKWHDIRRNSSIRAILRPAFSFRSNECVSLCLYCRTSSDDIVNLINCSESRYNSSVKLVRDLSKLSSCVMAYFNCYRNPARLNVTEINLTRNIRNAAPLYFL